MLAALFLATQPLTIAGCDSSESEQPAVPVTSRLQTDGGAPLFVRSSVPRDGGTVSEAGGRETGHGDSGASPEGGVSTEELGLDGGLTVRDEPDSRPAPRRRRARGELRRLSAGQGSNASLIGEIGPGCAHCLYGVPLEPYPPRPPTQPYPPRPATQRSAVRVRAAEIVVRGPLAPTEARRVLRRHTARIRACYERAVNRRPDVRGRLGVQLVVNTDGRVTSAAIQSSTLEDTNTESCVVQMLQRIRFPQPDGEGEVNLLVQYTFQRVE